MKFVEEKKGVKYWLGEPSDLQELFPFFLQIPRENELLGLLKTDISKTLEVLRDTLNSPEAACLIATVPHEEKENGIIVGAILLRKSTVWWSSTPFFTNVAFFTLPAFRHGHGIQEELVYAAKGFSESLKIPLFIDIFDNTENNNKKTRWFQWKKFKNIGFKVAYLPED